MSTRIPPLAFIPNANPADNPCVVPAGTLVGRFQLVGQSNNGRRGYEGQVLQARISSGTCTLIGLGRAPSTGGLYSAALLEGNDTAGKAGRYNDLRIGESEQWDKSGSVGGGLFTFTRKAGTSTHSTTTTTTPSEEGDNDPPVVKALASKGKPGRIVQLRYTISDDSGFAREEVWVYKGKTKKVLWKWRNDGFDEFEAGDVVFARWKAPATLRGTQKFCVRAVDEDGAQSPWSCSTVTIA